LGRWVKASETSGPRLPNLLVPERPRVGTGESFCVFAGKVLRPLSPNVLRCGQAQVRVISSIGARRQECPVDLREPHGLQIVVDHIQGLGSGQGGSDKRTLCTNGDVHPVIAFAVNRQRYGWMLLIGRQVDARSTGASFRRVFVRLSGAVCTQKSKRDHKNTTGLNCRDACDRNCALVSARSCVG